MQIIICIFMNINENIRNKRKIMKKKLRGRTWKFNYTSTAYQPVLPALVPIECLYIDVYLMVQYANYLKLYSWILIKY